MPKKTVDRHAWKWMAYGKHPSFADYVQVGQHTTMSRALCGWMDNGAERVLTKSRDMGAKSYRFWLSGPAEHSLYCGVLRSSSDRLGRQFPLLIAGEGELAQWKMSWFRLPVSLDKLWSHFEYVASRSYATVADLSKMIPGVIAEPQNCDYEGTDLTINTTLAMVPGGLCAEIPTTGEISLPALLLAVNDKMKDQLSAVPNAVFMGGDAQKTRIIAVTSPLGGGLFNELFKS